METRLIDLTTAELTALIHRAVAEAIERHDIKQAREAHGLGVVYGIKGLASLLGVSERTARYIKQSGTLRGAIRQQGRTIIIDSKRALELFGKFNH